MLANGEQIPRFIFQNFSDNFVPDGAHGSEDVKYHLEDMNLPGLPMRGRLWFIYRPTSAIWKRSTA